MFIQFLGQDQPDDAAIGVVLDHYIRQLYGEARRLISKRLQPLIDPADLLQSTRMILWVGLRKGKWKVSSSQQLIALAKTILRRQLSRICRALKAELTSHTIEFNLSDTITDIPVISLNKPAPGDNTEFDDIVQRIMTELDDVDRELVRLRLLGYSTAYAAKRLKMTAPSLRVRLGRLRKRLLEYGTLQRLLSDE
jgi:RNA polymerase sigma factor (sigma-70 family)